MIKLIADALLIAVGGYKPQPRHNRPEWAVRS